MGSFYPIYNRAILSLTRTPHTTKQILKNYKGTFTPSLKQVQKTVSTIYLLDMRGELSAPEPARRSLAEIMRREYYGRSLHTLLQVSQAYSYNP